MRFSAKIKVELKNRTNTSCILKDEKLEVPLDF